MCQLVESSKKNGRVQWEVVAAEFPNKTKDQIKSYYTAHLKQSAGANSAWTMVQMLTLIEQVRVLGKSWNVISKQYYDEKLSPDTLRM